MRHRTKESQISTHSLQHLSRDRAGPRLEIRDCGLADYHDILRLQQQLCRDRQLGRIGNTALIVEHRAVVTMGARQSLNKLLVGRDELRKRNIDIVEIRRGGGTTAHNPGQLVCYPILDLRQMGLGISEYVRTLETIGAELLGNMGVESSRRKGAPGLWVAERKIASIGVRVSKSVTYHGMAINIRNDLSIFDLMVPCGIENIEMTSVLKETGRDVSMEMVRKDLAAILVRRFSQNQE